MLKSHKLEVFRMQTLEIQTLDWKIKENTCVLSNEVGSGISVMPVRTWLRGTATAHAEGAWCMVARMYGVWRMYGAWFTMNASQRPGCSDGTQGWCNSQCSYLQHCKPYNVRLTATLGLLQSYSTIAISVNYGASRRTRPAGLTAGACWVVFWSFEHWFMFNLLNNQFGL